MRALLYLLQDFLILCSHLLLDYFLLIPKLLKLISQHLNVLFSLRIGLNCVLLSPTLVLLHKVLLILVLSFDLSHVRLDLVFNPVECLPNPLSGTLVLIITARTLGRPAAEDHRVDSLLHVVGEEPLIRVVFVKSKSSLESGHRLDLKDLIVRLRNDRDQ